MAHVGGCVEGRSRRGFPHRSVDREALLERSAGPSHRSRCADSRRLRREQRISDRAMVSRGAHPQNRRRPERSTSYGHRSLTPQMTTPMTLPLDDIRVIDLGQVYAAPYCTLQLAAMGADIIKIEPPGTGEVLRRPDLPDGVNYSFLMLNANKRSVTINLKDPRGQEILLKLLEDADVLVENYLDGVMESFGLGYDQIASRFPRLIYASGKGYGSGSRYARLGSMDNTIQAASGFISITGFPDRGVKTSATFIDMGTGSHLTSGILAALIHRGQTGKGQKGEVAMLDLCIPALTSVIATVREVEEVIADPEVAERGMLIDSTYPTRGDIKVTGSPVKLSAIPREDIPHGRPPELGEHNEEVLASIGISRDEVLRLREQGVI